MPANCYQADVALHRAKHSLEEIPCKNYHYNCDHNRVPSLSVVVLMPKYRLDFELPLMIAQTVVHQPARLAPIQHLKLIVFSSGIKKRIKNDRNK